MIKSGLWGRLHADSGFRVTLPVDPALETVWLAADGWSRAQASDVRMVWTEDGDGAGPRLVPLHHMGGRLVAVVRPDSENGGTVTITAPAPASGVIWQGFARHRRAIAWDQLLPGVPASAAVAPEIGGADDRKRADSIKLRVGKKIAAGDLDAALSEIALAVLGGRQGDVLPAAKLLLESLAKRPFLRNPSLGALAASLCSKSVSDDILSY